jgi:HlyD family secretion protein
MGTPQISSRRSRLAARITIVVLVSIGLVWAITAGRSRLAPAPLPIVERSAVTLDTVKRGELVREVHGVGMLVPEELVHIPAPYAGRVERVNHLAGAPVQPDQVIVELRNLEMERQALDAGWNVRTAETDIASLTAQIETQAVTHRADLAALQAQHRDAKLKNDRDQVLYKQGLVLELDYRLSTALVEDLAEKIGFELEKGKAMADSLAAQLSSKEASLKQLREILQLRRDELAALKVRPGVSGTLSEVLVQTGQQISAGAELATVVQPRKLKAVLALTETQARDVTAGQKAEIETSGRRIRGRVARIDPTVANGARTVDIRLDGALPDGTTPDESVDGTIEVERIPDAVYMSRPAAVSSTGEVSVFKVSPDGKDATRVKIRLGRSSFNAAEVLAGLTAGDCVIVSDMSSLDGYDRIRLK